MTQMHEVEENLFHLQGKLFQLTENNLVEVSQTLKLGDIHRKSELLWLKISVFTLRKFLKSAETLIKF